MVIWFGYRCDYCGERFFRWSRYDRHAAQHEALAKQKFWQSIIDSYRKSFSERVQIR